MPNAAYTFVPNVDTAAALPSSGILSRTLHNDDQNKVVQFSFAPGAGLSAHTAPCAACIYIVRGQADLQLGEEKYEVSAGAFAQMPAKLEHSILARTELVMLLIMNKGAIMTVRPHVVTS